MPAAAKAETSGAENLLKHLWRADRGGAIKEHADLPEPFGTATDVRNTDRRQRRMDPEAGVWWVEHSDLPGLNAEAESLEALRDKLPGAIQDLLEAAGHTGEEEVLVEVIAHAHTRVRLGAAA